MRNRRESRRYPISSGSLCWCWCLASRRPFPVDRWPGNRLAKEWIGQRVVPKYREFTIAGDGRRPRTGGQDRHLSRRGGQGRLAPTDARRRAERLGRRRAGRARRAGRRIFQRCDRQVSARSAQLRHAGHGPALRAGRPGHALADCDERSGSIPSMPSPAASAARSGRPRRTSTRRSPISARSSASTPGTRRLPRSRRRADV